MAEVPSQELQRDSRRKGMAVSARGFVADHPIPLAIGAVTAVALVVALWNLGGKPLWYDETFEALLVMHPPLRFAYWVATFETTGAFYHSLLWVWKFLGTNEFALRLPSVLFAVTAIPVTVFIGRRLVSTRWAIVAGLLLALSGLWLHHAQEVRPYSLYLLMAGLSTLALLRTLERPDRGRWIVYAAITVFAVWTHMMMVFVVLGHAVAMALHPDVRRWWRPAAASVVLAALAAVPIAFSITHANQARWDWIADPTPAGLRDGIWYLTSDTGFIALLWFVLWALGIAIGVRRWTTDRRSAWPIVLIAAISVTPILVPWLLSFVRPMYTPRYILAVLPAMILLGTLALSTIRPRVVAIGIACVLVGAGAINVWHWHADLKSDRLPDRGPNSCR